MKKCSPSVLCKHAYVCDTDDVKVDREGRDLERIACLAGGDIIVTHAPDSVRFMHSSGGWVEHDGTSIAQVEVMLFKAYQAIESQILFGDYSLLLGLDPEDTAERDQEGEGSYLHNSMVENLRKRAQMRVSELMETVTRRHLSALAARIPVYAQDPAFYDLLLRLPATAFDKVKVRPVIALAAGGAIDLSPEATAFGKSGILDPESYGLLHRTHHDRGAVELDPDVLTCQDSELDLPRRLLAMHYPDEFLQLAAYLLAYPADDMIAVMVGESGTGKSLFWQWVSWSTGSAELSNVSLITSRSQFTPLEEALTRAHIVALDEADAAKSTPIPFGQLNKATAERFDVNVKFGGYHPGVPRLGALVLVGNAWPSFDSTTPGLDRRVAWAWDTPLPARIEKEIYEALAKSSAAHQLLLAELVRRARVLRAMGVTAAKETLLTPAVWEAQKRMLDATTSPIKLALDDLLETGGSGDYVTSKRVQEIILEADIGKVPNQELKRVMGLYGAASTTTRVNGVKVRVWDGVRERAASAPARNGASSEPVPAPLPCSICGHTGGVLTDELLCADTAQCTARRDAMIRTGEWV